MTTETFDKAEWYYDGETIDENAASRHLYFVLRWLNGKGLLADSGKAWLSIEPTADVSLNSDDVTSEGADFLRSYYKRWYAEKAIINFQIDPDMEFSGSEGLDEYWAEFKKSR